MFTADQEVIAAVKKKLNELYDLCNDNNLPVFACVAVMADEKLTKTRGIYISPQTAGRTLPDRKFEDYIRISKNMSNEDVDDAAWEPLQD